MKVGLGGIEAGPRSKGREGIFLTLLSNAPRSYPVGELQRNSYQRSQVRVFLALHSSIFKIIPNSK